LSLPSSLHPHSPTLIVITLASSTASHYIILCRILRKPGEQKNTRKSSSLPPIFIPLLTNQPRRVQREKTQHLSVKLPKIPLSTSLCKTGSLIVYTSIQTKASSPLVIITKFSPRQNSGVNDNLIKEGLTKHPFSLEYR
jgi:hypothetical protein